MRSKPRPRTRRTHRLGVAAILTSGALAGLEAHRLWTRHRAPLPTTPAELLHEGELVARDTVEVLIAGHRAGSANENAVLNLFLSFGVTFGVARAATHAIRRGFGPLGNVRIANRHIHHFVPGIILALLSGGLSIGLRHEGLDQWLAVPFGAGSALIIDETALLIELSDVYWSERGVLSIDVGLGATSGLATLALLSRALRRGERLVPPPDLTPAARPPGG